MSRWSWLVLAHILLAYTTSCVISLIFGKSFVYSSTSTGFWQSPLWVVLFTAWISTSFRYISSWSHSFSRRSLIDQTILGSLRSSVPKSILFGVSSVGLLANLIIRSRSLRKTGYGEPGLSSNFGSQSLPFPCMVSFNRIVNKSVILVKVVFGLGRLVLGGSSKSKILGCLVLDVILVNIARAWGMLGGKLSLGHFWVHENLLSVVSLRMGES